MTFHIILAEDSRQGRRQNSNAMIIGDQLHVTDCEAKSIDLTNPNLLRVVEWDLRSPWIVMHKGADIVPLTVPAGWPDVTQDQHDEATMINQKDAAQ